MYVQLYFLLKFKKITLLDINVAEVVSFQGYLTFDVDRAFKKKLNTYE